MPNDAIHTGWTTTDETPVPVRVGSTPPPAADPLPISPIATQRAKTQGTIGPVTTESQMGLWLSALAGMGIVVIISIFAIGMDTLRGSLSGDESNTQTVTITPDGHFSPATLSIPQGALLTIENKSTDPQVLKVKEGPELFPVQVLFDTPFAFSVPPTALGTYMYFSETLPDDRTLIITVTKAIETQPTALAPDAALFPIPFADSLQPIDTPAKEPASLSVEQEPLKQGDTNGDAPVLIELGANSEAGEIETLGQNAIAVNPYTVGSEASKKMSEDIAGKSAKLHSGAPLLDNPRYHPRSNTSTGPVAWGVCVGAMLLFLAAYKARGWQS